MSLSGKGVCSVGGIEAFREGATKKTLGNSDHFCLRHNFFHRREDRDILGQWTQFGHATGD